MSDQSVKKLLAPFSGGITQKLSPPGLFLPAPNPPPPRLATDDPSPKSQIPNPFAMSYPYPSTLFPIPSCHPLD